MKPPTPLKYPFCSEKAFLRHILPFRDISWRVTISDNPCCWYASLFMEAKGMFQSILLAEYRGTFHDTFLLLANL